MKILRLFLLISLSVEGHTGIAQSQSASKDSIRAVIDELFNGYREGDSSRVKAVFTADANFQTIYTTEENHDKLSELKPVSDFLKYIGAGFTKVHDERLWDMHINYDSKLATVWTKYAFFLDEKFSHCGTETFLLRKINSTWKIYYLVDTRQKTGCILPADIKNN